MKEEKDYADIMKSSQRRSPYFAGNPDEFKSPLKSLGSEQQDTLGDENGGVMNHRAVNNIRFQ